jgi:hypothetical protein
VDSQAERGMEVILDSLARRLVKRYSGGADRSTTARSE